VIESVLLIGLGNIGLKYDIDSPINDSFLSHAGNIRNTLKPNLVYGIDLDKKARSVFSNKYSWDSFESIELLPKNFSPDLVVLATPPKKRIHQYNQILEFQNSILLIEKPLCESNNELEEAKNVFMNRAMGLFVNFHRRSNPSLVELRNELTGLEENVTISAFGFVSGNALSNVSHMVDLINFLMGHRDLVAGSVSSGGVRNFIGDNCEAYIHNFSKLNPTIFKLEIFTGTKFWEYDSISGTLIEGSVEPNPTYKDETRFSGNDLEKKTLDNDGLRFVYENLANFANGGSYNLCRIDEAVSSMSLYFNN
jgi:predicted dehydrogenase